MKNRTHKHATCPICNCMVIVWKARGQTAVVTRSLALADHVHEIHAKPIQQRTGRVA